MKITYALSADDLLQYQLYFISQNQSLKKRRRIMRWLVGAIYIAIGLQLYYAKDTFSSIVIFGGFGVIWMVFYPFYTRWRYKNYYRKQVLEYNDTKIGRQIGLQINPDHLFAKDEISESRIDYRDVHKLVWLKDQVLIQLESASALVIPKASVENLEEMKQLFESKNIPFVDDSQWRWK